MVLFHVLSTCKKFYEKQIQIRAAEVHFYSYFDLIIFVLQFKIHLLSARIIIQNGTESSILIQYSHPLIHKCDFSI